MPINIQKGVYKHYKKKYYEVFFVALHSETLEPLVVYRTLHANDKSEYWVRPYSMFSEEITLDGQRQPRFQYVGLAEELIGDHVLTDDS